MKWLSKKFITQTVILSLFIALSACGPLAPAKPNIQQGNEITESEINRIKMGMTKEQVAAAVGSPILLNIFRQDEWNYVYTTSGEHQPFKEKLVSVQFQNNQVVNIQKSNYQR